MKPWGGRGKNNKVWGRGRNSGPKKDETENKKEETEEQRMKNKT